ncbi:bifunctional 4-hydroxy-2-oxoglutarate aldolase/2-dehydro-3-deoxy-phosphogluconate aldolase [Aquiluna sp. Uisw_065]|uniref:bifunctional 4-hydroxy-2-oxoglutarate aldolase/2-dehydro-3-deoxy-phosphogluconate aldolase n=1 Tax=Aquiluna sp. Uisw_065 TaxID=3230967 RepID=UPI0039ED09D5
MVNNLNASLTQDLINHKLIAILRGKDVDSTVLAAKTLFESGVKILEVTLTLENAYEAIRQISTFVPSGYRLGAGTVLSALQVDQSLSAGASFIVTPTISESVGYAAGIDIPTLAGAFSPTEIKTAHNFGVAGVKLFPSFALGPKFIRAVLDPMPELALIAVGGVGLEDVRSYLDAGAIAVGVGGPLLGDGISPGGNQIELGKRASQYLKQVGR